MKNPIFIIASLCFSTAISQVAGNARASYPINGQNGVRMEPTVADFTSHELSYLSVKGVVSIVPDSYIAVFGIEQTGKTADETNSLYNKRMENTLVEINKLTDVKTFQDLISFQAKYETEKIKKIFNKDTYIEVPVGFELRKNLHVSFKDIKQLDALIAILAKNEVYNLIKVDCFSTTLDNAKKDLQEKVKLALQEKVKLQQAIVPETFSKSQHRLNEAEQTYYPTELYNGFSIASHADEIYEKSSYMKRQTTDNVLYYTPYLYKDFDVVINAESLVPTIQYVYSLTLENNLKNDTNKTVYVLNDKGELKPLVLN